PNVTHVVRKLVRRGRQKDLLWRRQLFHARRLVNIGSMVTTFEGLQIPGMNPNAEPERPAWCFDRFRCQPLLNVNSAAAGSGRLFKGEKKRVAHRVDLPPAVCPTTLANQAEVTTLNPFQVSAVALPAVAPQRQIALSRA